VILDGGPEFWTNNSERYIYITKDLNDGTPPITDTVMILINSSKRVGLDSLEGC
jgi:hypothetical protein